MDSAKLKTVKGRLYELFGCVDDHTVAGAYRFTTDDLAQVIHVLLHMEKAGYVKSQADLERTFGVLQNLEFCLVPFTKSTLDLTWRVHAFGHGNSPESMKMTYDFLASKAT